MIEFRKTCNFLFMVRNRYRAQPINLNKFFAISFSTITTSVKVFLFANEDYREIILNVTFKPEKFEK